MKVLAVLALAVAIQVGFGLPSCDNDSDCASNECCVEESRFYIATKRDDPVLQLDPFTISRPYGRCVQYYKGGSYCGGFANCGCVSGYTCIFHMPKPLIAIPPKVAIPIKIVTRSMIPGAYSKCEKDES